MNRSVIFLSLALLLAGWAAEARAQYGYGYPRGYGGYGWGGWGGTAQGSIARGMGVFNMGRGIYNVDTAEARSMNADTRMRWNSYVFQSQMAANRRYQGRVRARQARTNEDQREILDRLRNHPETRNIIDGDALNVLLDALLNPALADRSLQYIRTPLRPEVIPDIPFEVATEGMTVCLDAMTMDGQWPLALSVEAFRPDREALRLAVQKALKEDEQGDLEPATIDAVQVAIDKLRLKFEKLVPQDQLDYIPARNALKAMAGLTKMLYSPKIEKILAELEDYQGTTLGDLLGFMQAFNLRFATSNSYRQRQIYLKLYPMLAEQANGTLAAAAPAGRGAAGGGREPGRQGRRRAEIRRDRPLQRHGLGTPQRLEKATGRPTVKIISMDFFFNPGPHSALRPGTLVGALAYLHGRRLDSNSGLGPLEPRDLPVNSKGRSPGVSMRLELGPAHPLERLLGGGFQTLASTIRSGGRGFLAAGLVADGREGWHKPGIDFDLSVGGGRTEAEIIGIHEGDQVAHGPFLVVVKLGQERLHARIV